MCVFVKLKAKNQFQNTKKKHSAESAVSQNHLFWNVEISYPNIFDSLKPYLHGFFAAGFAFGKIKWMSDYNIYDLNYPYLFAGEEQLVTLRLWTRGYDFYAPYRKIIYHKTKPDRQKPAQPSHIINQCKLSFFFFFFWKCFCLFLGVPFGSLQAQKHTVKL